jgi:hypothetical protein
VKDQKEKLRPAGRKQPGRAGTGADEHLHAGARFEAAYHNYVKALQEGHADATGRWADAQRDHAGALQKMWLETQKILSDIHHQYVAAVQDALGQEEAGPRATEAYLTYQRSRHEACDEAQGHYEEAHRAHTELLQSIGADVSGQWESAYRNYVTEIKETLAVADADSIDPHTLAAIGHSFTSAAAFASHTVGSGSAAKKRGDE